MPTHTTARPKYRGTAGTADEVAGRPLAAISRPLLIPRPGNQPPEPTEWQALVGLSNGQSLYDYASLVRSRRAFALGGLQLVIECGLVVDWYRNDATRRDALELIEARGARDLLNSLSDKDTPTSIFGKNDLRDFFRTFPPVSREVGHAAAPQYTTQRSIRQEHPLRLRKALEFIFLTEAVLRWRFKVNETMERFHAQTGVRVRSVDDAQAIWGYMWIEPLLYVLDPAPREADIEKIASNPGICGAFTAHCGQHAEVLNSILFGVPGTFLTVEAAARACDRFYTNRAAPTHVVTVTPDQHERRLNLLYKSGLGNELLARAVESVVQLAP